MTTQSGPALMSGLAQTLLSLAGFVTVAAIVIFVEMPQGLQGSLITLPPTPADRAEEPETTA